MKWGIKKREEGKEVGKEGGEGGREKGNRKLYKLLAILYCSQLTLPQVAV